MDKLTQAPKHIKLTGAMLALAALFIGLLAVAFATGPAQAQSKTYPPPQPCGQGHADVPKSPAAQIVVDKTPLKIALFDAYWDIPTRTINNNLCPPSVTEQDDGEGGKTVARADAKIDIDKTVVHVTDKYKVTVVNSKAPGYDPSAVSGPTIDLKEYPFLRHVWGLAPAEAPTAGTQVYWLRLDDPDTSADETSDLVLGFSTKLFDGRYWEARDRNMPLRYEFQSERDNIFEVHGPHFFAFGAPQANNAPQPDALWDSYDANINRMQMEAGVDFQEVQWVFTEPGTHHIQVQVKGQVIKEPPGASDDWKQNPPEEKTVTSEVQVYTIQSGSLSFNDQPMFQVERSVKENSASGVKVGAPVPVAGGNDGDTLTYGLAGKGSSLFDVVAAPDGAQVTVAAGAMLDYESQATYDLVLGVSDGRDREGQLDPSIDSTVALKIKLEDVTGDPKVTIAVDDPTPALRQRVLLTSSLSGDIPAAENLRYNWEELDLATKAHRQLNISFPKATTTYATWNDAGQREYQLHLHWQGRSGGLASNTVTVTWAADH